jgi:hypothetical protein
MVLLGVMGAAIAACGGSSKSNAGDAAAATAAALPPTTLGAVKQAPASMAIDDAAWARASVMTVKTDVVKGTEATEPVDVSVQALYSDTDVWFRLQWADSSQNDSSLWQYDGSAWGRAPGMTDRVSLLWPMTAVSTFESKGCYAACHRPAAGADASEKPYMILPAADEMADNWQWTASTGPQNQVSDRTLQGALSKPDNIGSAFVSDTLDGGGTVSNSAKAPDVGPVKMQDPAKPATYGPNYLVAAEAVPLDMSKIKAGDTIPRSMIDKPWAGSRGDIDAMGVYANGTWTLVMHRKLDTGQTDDLKFDPTQSYLFELAVWNGVDQVNHTVGHDVYTLTFLK